MQGAILLNYGENIKQVESEEIRKFLHSLLFQIGIPLEGIWDTDDELKIDQKIKLRSLLAKHNIQVIDDMNGHVQVYVDELLVGEWFKCTYTLKRDLSELDRKKQLRMEMHINFWTIFEGQENQ